MTEKSYKNIKNKIFDYLSRQGFSEKKLLLKVIDLKKRYPKTKRYEDYTTKNIKEVIEDLKKDGYVDDYAYAQSVLRQLKDKKDSIRRIQEKMYRRLIPSEIIQKVLEEFTRDGGKQEYTKIIHDVQKKHQNLTHKLGASQKNVYIINKKIYAYIAQKGFSPDEIRCIQQQATKEAYEEDDDF